MSAVAPISQTRRPRASSRRGMRLLAAGLTVVCIIELLFAFEQTHAMAAWRAARDIPAPRLDRLWSDAATSLGIAPPLRALYIRTNDAHPNFRLTKASLDAPGEWEEVQEFAPLAAASRSEWTRRHRRAAAHGKRCLGECLWHTTLRH